MLQETQDEEMVKKSIHKKRECTKEMRTRLNTLAVLSLLSLGLRLRNSILEVSRGAFYVKDKLFGILHHILDGEMQLKIWTGISIGNQK
jgi:hypothetical protein